MAEGILKSLLAEKKRTTISVSSMGTSAFDGESPTMNAIDAMKEVGIDISQKKSQRVTVQDLLNADLIYVMTPSHWNILTDAVPEVEDKIRILNIPDPYGQNLNIYRDCRDKMILYFKKEFEQGGRLEHAGTSESL